MKTETYEDIIGRLIEMSMQNQKMISESEERITKVMEIGNKMLQSSINTRELTDKSIKYLRQELDDIRADRDRTLERCDILLKQNMNLIEQLSLKDVDLRELRERYDRLLSVLESSIYAHKSQPTTATVAIGNTDMLNKIGH